VFLSAVILTFPWKNCPKLTLTRLKFCFKRVFFTCFSKIFKNFYLLFYVKKTIKECPVPLDISIKSNRKHHKTVLYSKSNKNMVGWLFGQFFVVFWWFFHKNIWSPCSYWLVFTAFKGENICPAREGLNHSVLILPMDPILSKYPADRVEHAPCLTRKDQTRVEMYAMAKHTGILRQIYYNNNNWSDNFARTLKVASEACANKHHDFWIVKNTVVS